MAKIAFKGVFITDKGQYTSGSTYATGDIVHTDKGVYRSKTDSNSTNPDTDTTGAWETWCDLTDVAAAK